MTGGIALLWTIEFAATSSCIYTPLSSTDTDVHACPAHYLPQAVS